MPSQRQSPGEKLSASSGQLERRSRQSCGSIACQCFNDTPRKRMGVLVCSSGLTSYSAKMGINTAYSFSNNSFQSGRAGGALATSICSDTAVLVAVLLAVAVFAVAFFAVGLLPVPLWVEEEPLEDEPLVEETLSPDPLFEARLLEASLAPVLLDDLVPAFAAVLSPFARFLAALPDSSSGSMASFVSWMLFRSFAVSPCLNPGLSQ